MVNRAIAGHVVWLKRRYWKVILRTLFEISLYKNLKDGNSNDYDGKRQE